jgi:hypothetical protein
MALMFGDFQVPMLAYVMADYGRARLIQGRLEPVFQL